MVGRLAAQSPSGGPGDGNTAVFHLDYVLQDKRANDASRLG